ncbi:MAG TPA: endonuclease/exonuclease/phosphatase family protein [Anaerolineales bacterium]|jgi:endonuclease/exonuclease/phosphatase family metal-dependent hydrolase|nr:endonuclease/exonuclease/phosphatase family protein [Anaerolineales bacterium]
MGTKNGVNYSRPILPTLEDIAIMTASFSLLTFNCFGTPVPKARRRLRALARQLEDSDIQLVCLQEVQLVFFQRLLIQACSSYPFQAYEPHLHSPKGGLVTLSRVPLAAQRFETYTEQGRWYLPTAMDRFLRKGMLISSLHWQGVPVVVINTHVIANYNGDWERQGVFAKMQEKQLHQLAEVVSIQPSDALVVVVGDFNIPRGSRLYTNFLHWTGLIDTLAQDQRPTHRPPRGVPAQYSLPIDFTFVRMPSSLSLQINCDLRFSNKLQLTHRHQDYLSDHNAIEVSFTAKSSIQAGTS